MATSPAQGNLFEQPLAELQELLEIIGGMLGENVVSRKRVRSLPGKASRVASLVWAWRPFLSELWTALSDLGADARATGCPRGCIWARHIQTDLAWMAAFCRREQGSDE